jgi:hypothetical protein
MRIRRRRRRTCIAQQSDEKGQQARQRASPFEIKFATARHPESYLEFALATYFSARCRHLPILGPIVDPRHLSRRGNQIGHCNTVWQIRSASLLAFSTFGANGARPTT